MAIINRTPDSFFDKGSTFELDSAVAAAHRRGAAMGRISSTSAECRLGAAPP